jgi:hypothetical protein
MACKNPDYKDFCRQVYKYVPACEEIDNKNIDAYCLYSGNPSDAGMVVQFFEFGRLLMGKKIKSMHAQGTCMYPCIRPGDILHIAPCGIKQIKIGDIPVYRRFNRLYAHRAIDKGSKDGFDFIVTRPDTSGFGNDGPVFDSDVLGIVSHIKRKGKVSGTAKATHPFFNKLFLRFYIYLYSLRGHLQAKGSFFLKRLQQCRAYRNLAGFLFLGEGVEIVLQSPINAKPNSRFFSQVSETELLKLLNAIPGVSKWSIQAKINSSLVCYMSFICKPANCPFRGWWAYEAMVKARYRGTAVERIFLEELQRILERLGIKKVSVSVFKNMKTEKAFFSNMGFQTASCQNDVFLKDSDNQPSRRIIMAKEILP